MNYKNLIFQFVPPTAGIRILSVDRGSVREVIPLTFLQHLNSLLAPFRCATKDNFDFVCGILASKNIQKLLSLKLIIIGGLVIISMFLL